MRSIPQSILVVGINHNTTSDHSSITITLSLPSSLEKITPQHAWHKATWDAFTSHSQSADMDISNLGAKEDTLHAISNITILIHQAIDIAVPFREPGKKVAPWWIHSLMLAKRAVKQADSHAGQNPTAINREDTHLKCSHWSTMVQQAKNTYRIKQVQSASTTTV